MIAVPAIDENVDFVMEDELVLPSSAGASGPPNDVRWLTYVGGLDPDDREGAFLLPDELPAENASREEVIRAIETATRRALLPPTELSDEQVEKRRAHREQRMRILRELHRKHNTIEIHSYKVGKLNGTMRVMCPQGREMIFDFQDELGYEATLVWKETGETQQIYYRSQCMNVARMAVAMNGSIDASSVTFQEMGDGEMMQLFDDARLNQRVNPALRHLARQYRQLQDTDA